MAIGEIVEILNEDKLLRRAIFTDPNYVKDDMTISSFAFKLRRGESGLSVDIERFTTHEESIINIEKYRLFSVLAHDVRAIGLDCFHRPLEINYAHSEIVGTVTNSKSSLLAKSAIYVHYPE